MHQIRIFLAIAGLACLGHSFAQTKSPIALKYFSQGKALEKKDVGAAVKNYLSAAKEADGKDQEMAMTSVRRAIDIWPGDNSSEIHYWIIRLVKELQSGKSDSLAASFYFSAGSFYDVGMNRGDSAIQFYQLALKIRSKIFGEVSEPVAVCYHRMGDVAKYLTYDFNGAENYYEKALAIREKLPVKNDRELAMNFYNLATTNRSQHDYEKAVAYGNRALSMVEKLRDNNFLEITYSGMANIYRDKEDLTLAMDFYLKAIDLNKQNSIKNNIPLANHYLGLGLVLRKENNFTEALGAFQNSLTIYSGFNPKPLLFVYTLHQLGETYSIMDNEVKALEAYRKSLEAIKQIKVENGGQLSDILRSVGNHYKKRGMLDSALFYYQQSLHAAVPTFTSTNSRDSPSVESISLSEEVCETITAKASVFSLLYGKTHEVQWATEALKNFSLAESLLSSGRTDLDLETSQWRYLDSKFELYEQSLEVIFDLFQNTSKDSLLEISFYYIEKSKAKSLSDALAMAENSNPNLFVDPLLDSLRRFRTSAASFQNRLMNAVLERERNHLQNAIVDIDRKITTTEAIIDLKYPSYRQIKYSYESIKLETVRNYASQNNAVVIEYFWGNSFVYALGINQTSCLLKRLGPTDSINASILKLMKHVAPETDGIGAIEFKNFCFHSNFLYTVLIDPFSDLLKDNERIVVIPDGAIAQIPMEMLIKNKPVNSRVDYKGLDYLILSHSIGYSFSSSILLHKKKATISDPRLLAVGFTGGPYRSFPDSSTNEIPGSALELKLLSNRFETGKFLQGDNASETNFKDLSPTFDLIHLAVHGKGDPDKEFSASLFFRKDADFRNDGELHWYELYELKLSAALVVLSACESGIGTSYRGEGMQSMASAFTYAGCQNLVLGLWKVSDQVSVQLMESFYSSVINGYTIDDALSISKRDYLNDADELTANPKLWASLIVYGNQTIIINKKNQWFYRIGISIGIVLFIFFLWGRLKRPKVVN